MLLDSTIYTSYGRSYEGSHEGTIHLLHSTISFSFTIYFIFIKAMTMMNRQMNLPAMQKIMMEFEQQTEKMDMKEEMMNDTLDDVMEGDDDEEKSEEILNQVRIDYIFIRIVRLLIICVIGSR